MKPEKFSRREKALQVGDVLFIWVLCFTVLLLTMVLRGRAGQVGEAGYHIQPATFAAVGGALALYFFFLIKSSTKDLQQMLKNAYRKQGREDEHVERGE